MKQNIIRQFSVAALSLCLLHSGTAFATEKKSTATHQKPVVSATTMQPQVGSTTLPESKALPPLRMPTPILGQAVLPKEQAIAFIAQSNPMPKLNCSIVELVNYYYEEAGQEGVRADLALSQALLETGFFRYGGAVKPEQNNFCGLGTTAGKVGAAFTDARLGVRAHIQHLMAYSTSRLPVNEIVDPRYFLVWQMTERYAQHSNWEDLDGRWATGPSYSAKIFAIYDRMRSAPFMPMLEMPKPSATEKHFIVISPEARGK